MTLHPIRSSGGKPETPLSSEIDTEILRLSILTETVVKRINLPSEDPSAIDYNTPKGAREFLSLYRLLNERAHSPEFANALRLNDPKLEGVHALLQLRNLVSDLKKSGVKGSSFVNTREFQNQLTHFSKSVEHFDLPASEKKEFNQLLSELYDIAALNTIEGVLDQAIAQKDSLPSSHLENLENEIGRIMNSLGIPPKDVKHLYEKMAQVRNLSKAPLSPHGKTMPAKQIPKTPSSPTPVGESVKPKSLGSRFVSVLYTTLAAVKSSYSASVAYASPRVSQIATFAKSFFNFNWKKKGPITPQVPVVQTSAAQPAVTAAASAPAAPVSAPAPSTATVTPGSPAPAAPLSAPAPSTATVTPGSPAPAAPASAPAAPARSPRSFRERLFGRDVFKANGLDQSAKDYLDKMKKIKSGLSSVSKTDALLTWSLLVKKLEEIQTQVAQFVDKAKNKEEIRAEFEPTLLSLQSFLNANVPTKKGCLKALEKYETELTDKKSEKKLKDIQEALNTRKTDLNEDERNEVNDEIEKLLKIIFTKTKLTELQTLEERFKSIRLGNPSLASKIEEIEVALSSFKGFSSKEITQKIEEMTKKIDAAYSQIPGTPKAIQWNNQKRVNEITGKIQKELDILASLKEKTEESSFHYLKINDHPEFERLKDSFIQCQARLGEIICNVAGIRIEDVQKLEKMKESSLIAEIGSKFENQAWRPQVILHNTKETVRKGFRGLLNEAWERLPTLGEF